MHLNLGQVERQRSQEAHSYTRKTRCVQWPFSEPEIQQAEQGRDGQRELPRKLTDPFPETTQRDRLC